MPADESKAYVEKIATLAAANPENICLQTFTELEKERGYYGSLSPELQERLQKCMISGVENLDSGMGCYACRPDDYSLLEPFFEKALKKYHGVTEINHKNDWELAEGTVTDLSTIGLGPLSMRVRTGRNLKKFPLPGSMTKDDRVNMEVAMGKVFDSLIAKPEFGGKYVSITPGHAKFVDDAAYNQLVKEHVMFKDMSADPYLLSAGIAGDWPYGRGCYVSEDKGFIIWVGEEDHLRIMAMQKGTDLNLVFNRLKTAINVVEELIEGGCARHEKFGVVTSCPTNIGTGMRFSVHIPLKNLCADGTDTKAKEVCKKLFEKGNPKLSVRGTGGEHTPIVNGIVDISPSARFCISEADILSALLSGLTALWKEENNAEVVTEPPTKAAKTA